MTTPNRPEWVFEKVPPMGGARATAWRDTLEGSDFSQEERVAREAIQNSVDATLPNEKTEVAVRNKTLSAADMASVREALYLDSPNSPLGRLEKLGLRPDNAFQRFADGASGGVRTTVIEDWNTRGLGYDAQDGKDRFEELCLYLGQDSADVDGARGGSYGFGKTVYQQASDCHTFIVYSVFKPSAKTNGCYSRLFVCSRFDGHEAPVSGEKCMGRAWFGIRSTSEAGVKCDPVTDEEAACIAERLGFVARSPNDFGTSIMILGSDLNIGEFKKAVEDYWWPRTISNLLTVELRESDGSPSIVPEPLERDDLKPYIRCYDIASGEMKASDRDRKHQLRGRDRVRRGTLGLTPLDLDDADDAESQARFRNTVALIRSVPMMVVEYKDPKTRLAGNYAGAFLSDRAVEDYLHLSEPPLHDEWQPDSPRLKEKHPDKATLVKQILDTIRRRAREYQQSLNPPPKQTSVDGPDALKRILAGIMSGTPGSPPYPPTPSQDLFNVTIRESRINSPTQSTVRAEVKARLKDDALMESADAIMTVRPTVAMDDNLVRGELIKLSKVMVNNEKRRPTDGDFNIPFQIAKNRDVAVEIESAPFDRDLYADLEVSMWITDSDAADDD